MIEINKNNIIMNKKLNKITKFNLINSSKKV